MKQLILAIETSCDETAMCIIDEDKNILAHIINSQAQEFASLGGVVPEMASRNHVDNIFLVYKEVLTKAQVEIEDISYIAVTYGPGLIGSLLVGVNFANSLSLLYGIPIIPINHMQAHIYAITNDHQLELPHLSLIISGGHTDLVLVNDVNNFELIGYTQDDAVGECFDKVARLLGLNYPGGPEIEKRALLGEDTYSLPQPMNDNSLNFSFSGLKSASFNLVNTMKMKNQTININDFCNSFQNTVAKTLKSKLQRAIDIYKPKSISCVGGVSCNKFIQNQLKDIAPNIVFPSNQLSTDNALMIGLLAIEKLKHNIQTYKVINANPSVLVEDNYEIK